MDRKKRSEIRRCFKLFNVCLKQEGLLCYNDLNAKRRYCL